MKLTSKIALAVLLLAVPATVFAAPRSKNPQRATQAGRFAAASFASTQSGPVITPMQCAGCKTVVVERRVGTQKATVRTTKTECSGCETMAAGQQCH